MRRSSRPALNDARTGTINKPFEDLVAVRIARLADVMARLANQAVTAQVGARNVDLRLLNILEAAEGLTVNEIARRIHIDKAWVSRSLRRLEKSGLVSRRGSCTDARICLVHLSSSGRAALERMKPLTSAREKRLLEGLDETQFKADLDRLMTNARKLLASKDDLL